MFTLMYVKENDSFVLGEANRPYTICSISHHRQARHIDMVNQTLSHLFDSRYNSSTINQSMREGEEREEKKKIFEKNEKFNCFYHQ